MAFSSSIVFFFLKQKTAYEVGIGDWSSDVCSSDLRGLIFAAVAVFIAAATTGEWIVLTMAGAPDAAVVGRSVAASLALGLAVFAMAAVFRRLFVHRWAAALATLMFAVGALALKPPMPSLMHAFERGIRPAPAATTSTPAPLSAPRAVLMTDLQLVWGEAVATAVLNGEASPPATYRALTEVAAIVPVDAIGPATPEERKSVR